MGTHWLGYILAATILYSLVTLLDRFIMGRRVMTPIGYLLIGNLVGLFVAGIAWYKFSDSVPLTGLTLFVGAVVGIFYGIFNYLYFDTLRLASPVATVAYMQIIPVIAALGGIFVLNEHVTEFGYTAILLLCVGLTFVSLLDQENAMQAASRMLPAAMILSVAYILQKSLLSTNSIVTVLLLNRAGATLMALLTFAVKRARGDPNIIALIRSTPIGIIAAIAGEIVSVLALYWSLLAYDRGPLAEVSALASLLPVAVLVFAAILRKSTGFPFWALPEAKSKIQALLTIVATTLITASVYLIFSKGIISAGA